MPESTKSALMILCAGAAIQNAQAQEKESTKKAEDRPNILWVTFEDTSASEFHCYGNEGVNTPISDALAASGIQFMNAWSCGPQSSPARSCLITSCYATTYGMDVHPVPYDTPEHIYFPQWLRDAGYFCTNNHKTHYNSTVDHKSCWDECGKQASWHSEKRGENQPFFAVYNCMASHMGRVRTFHTDGRRDYTKEGIYKDKLVLPDYVPDLPEVRSDYAGHLEAVQDIDEWLGYFLKDLKDSGEADNTIVFFFSDHGGCIARGKGYLYESGLRVPMLAYIPPKYRELAGVEPGRNYDLVSFVDLGATMLSLAGVEPPAQMQGRALMGKYRELTPRKYNFALAANHLHHFTPTRAVTDGRFKLLRTYLPYRQFAMRNYYQWGMPSNKSWDRYILSGKNENPAWALPFGQHPAEMLFDLENDPGEIHDLSQNPRYAGKLEELRNALSEHIRSTVDLGFFLPTSREHCVLYDKVRTENYPLEELYQLVELAGIATKKDVAVLKKYLRSDKDEFKYWAAVGYASLARHGELEKAPKALQKLMKDSNPYVAAEASYAMAYLGKAEESVKLLAAPVENPDYRKIYYSALECISLDPAMRPVIKKYALSDLKKAAEELPHKHNEDAGLMARGILVNLGELDIDLLHGEEAYQEGLRLNKGRRKKLPLPR